MRIIAALAVLALACACQSARGQKQPRAATISMQRRNLLLEVEAGAELGSRESAMMQEDTSRYTHAAGRG